MLRNIIAYTLIIIGFLGFVFFGFYKGDHIPYSGFFMVVSMIIIFIGAFSPTSKKSLSVNTSKQIQQFKNGADKIIVDIDHCEFKENNYDETIETKAYFKYESANYNADNTQIIEKSYLIYVNKIGEETKKFTSQVFPFNSITLKKYVLTNSITLAIDKLNKDNYFFELQMTK